MANKELEIISIGSLLEIVLKGQGSGNFNHCYIS